MPTIIHAELDALCFLILAVIARQITNSVSQQLNRVIFRTLVNGIMVSLALDVAWVVIEGKQFPGAVLLNQTINALYLGVGVILGGIWYLYVLERLGYEINRKVIIPVMAPGVVFMMLNLISIRTGWIFTVSEENVYSHGPLFWLQLCGALSMLLVSLVHLHIRLLGPKTTPSRREIMRLLLFYILPVIGTLIAIPYTGLPGTWTCASVSVMLIYIDDQDREILRDSLTGMNNRKTLENAFAEYARQHSEGKQLFLYMMDLDNFKGINDTLGHSTGDRALVQAAGLLTASVSGMKAYTARLGGDEFLVMGLFSGEVEALAYKHRLTDSFREFREKEQLPYPLGISVGYSLYQPGQTSAELIEKADEQLYREKEKKKVGRTKKTGSR